MIFCPYASAVFVEEVIKEIPGHVPVIVHTSIWNHCQANLNKLGYRAGPVNGVLNKSTQGAIRRFQRDIGRSETGKPSMALLRDLDKALIERTF